jgi:hypothetical protein
MMKKQLLEIGWREEVLIKDLAPRFIKAKIDTGARTSALHVTNLVFFKKGKKDWVRFKVHPIQDSSHPAYSREQPIKEMRKVRSSNGQESLRPVVELMVTLGAVEFSTEITLVNRDMMGFRMLLGRKALKNRFTVNVARSYLHKKKQRKK